MTDNTASEKTTEKVRNDPAFMPPVDVIEDAAGITLYADLPGVPKENLHLRVEGDNLTLEGDVNLPIPEGMEATHAEFNRPKFRRVFTLSKELDTEKVQAEFQGGVLRLRIPRVDHAQPRKVQINVA